MKPNMRPDSWVDEVLGTRAKVRVLRAMAREPGRYWVERELSRDVGMSPSTVNQAVGQLRDLNILESHRFGKVSVVRLRSTLHVNRILVHFFQQEAKTWKRIEADLRRHVPKQAAVYLFGSTGRGTATAESDIDFLVLAATPSQAQEAAAAVRRVVQRHLPVPLDVIALDAKAARRREHRALVKTVLREGRPLTARAIEAPP